ncbi:MAG: type I-U CRISPR-associated protein Csx17 [Desulfobacteraceae bacterium]|nr:type I-U CRISPR-associated protein Csx17 [Desulfobacteraceae bacterium]MCF8095254.1 type I-U CRISPR-associated protein Csx17 [Desulfobacteraceae bacterium]
MNEIVLTGCKSRPLAGYLKSMAVLRLLAEQKDPGVKGAWKADTFVVQTSLTVEALMDFFCNEYAPTPIITPWNGSSGFYPNDSKDGLRAILESDQPRFAIYAKAIRAVTSWPEWAKELKTPAEVISGLGEMLKETAAGKKQDEIKTLADAVKTPPDIPDLPTDRPVLSENIDDLKTWNEEKGINTKERETAWKDWLKTIGKAVTKYSEYIRQKNKDIILPLCRARLPDACVQWLDAVCAIHEDRRISYNRLLGTGGNDARLEFGSNFMRQIAYLLIKSKPQRTMELLNGALFAAPVTGMPGAKIGQFDPGRAGGYNQGMEVETKDFKANPWDYVLSLEGALMMASAIVRRHSVDQSALTSPFSVRFSPVGFTSSEYTETGANETWLPLWAKPAGYHELKHVFGEGRSSLGRRQSTSGLEFSRAVGSLGVDRGIVAFERYSYLKRRGDTHVAVPVGKIPVKYQPGMELLAELDPITDRLDQFRKGFKNEPATYKTARKQIDEAIFSCALRAEPYQFISLVCAVGQMNRLTGMRDLRKMPKLNRPIYGLSPRWITYCDDGSPEVRIAAAIASIEGNGKIGPVMSNLAGVSPNAPWHWDENKEQQHWVGSYLAERIANLLAYRIMDADRKSVEKIPLSACLEIHAEDAMPFLYGLCDDRKIEDLMWGFAAINWGKTGLKNVRYGWRQPAVQSVVSRTWCLLKLLHIPHDINGKMLKYETRIPRLLLAGRVDEACETAARRLRVSELPPYPVKYGSNYDSVRMLASLIIPLKNREQLAARVLKTKPQTTGVAYA